MRRRYKLSETHPQRRKHLSEGITAPRSPLARKTSAFVVTIRGETLSVHSVTSEPIEKNKEGHIARRLRSARKLGREPTAILPLLRGWFVKAWMTRGGGFYGLGYVITFTGLEIRTLTGDFGGSGSVSGFIAAQAIQYVVRFSIESIFNSVFALLWPLHLFRWLGGFGLVVLALGYVAFEFAVRPLVEAWLPELRQARILMARSKQERREQKRLERAKNNRS
jgi:hypothetical protein